MKKITCCGDEVQKRDWASGRTRCSHSIAISACPPHLHPGYQFPVNEQSSSHPGVFAQLLP